MEARYLANYSDFKKEWAKNYVHQDQSVNNFQASNVISNSSLSWS
jgi:hypothetical protein